MEEFFKSFNEIEWRTYDTFAALHAFRSFWRETEGMITVGADEAEKRDGPKWHPTSEAEAAEFSSDRRVARHLHDEVIMPTFRYGALTMLFAMFERELKRFVENYQKANPVRIGYRDLRGSLLEQVVKR